MVNTALAVALVVMPVLKAFALKVSGRSIKTVPPEATVRSELVGVTPLVV
jgi:hypothetical protein